MGLLVKKFFWVFAFFAAFTARPVFADEGVFNIWAGTSTGGCNKSPVGCSFNDALVVLVNVIELFFEVAMIGAGVMFIYGGVLFLISRGSQTQVGKAKAAMQNAAVGLVIALAATALINTIQKWILSG